MDCYKYTDDQFKTIYQAIVKDNQISMERICKSPQIESFLDSHPEYKANSIIQLIIDALGVSSVLQFISFSNFMPHLSVKSREAVLNKNKNIYPSLP